MEQMLLNEGEKENTKQMRAHTNSPRSLGTWSMPALWWPTDCPLGFLEIKRRKVEKNRMRGRGDQIVAQD